MCSEQKLVELVSMLDCMDFSSVNLLLYHKGWESACKYAVLMQDWKDTEKNMKKPLKKNHLCQSQGWACPARHTKWSLNFIHNLFFFLPLFFYLLQNGKSHPKKSNTLPHRYGRRSCFAHLSKNPLVSHIFHPTLCWSRSLTFIQTDDPVVFLQSIGLELFISFWTESDFDLTLLLH